MASVVSNSSRQRARCAAELDEVTIVADLGLEGDWRSRRQRSRQITLVEAEALEHVARDLGLGERAAGQLASPDRRPRHRPHDTGGQRLRLGEVLLEVGRALRPCANMEAKIARGAERARDGRGGVRARVVAGVSSGRATASRSSARPDENGRDLSRWSFGRGFGTPALPRRNRSIHHRDRRRCRFAA